MIKAYFKLSRFNYIQLDKVIAQSSEILIVFYFNLKTICLLGWFIVLFHILRFILTLIKICLNRPNDFKLNIKIHYNKIDITASLSYKRLAFLSISQLFVDKIWHFLQFYHLDKNVISHGFLAHFRALREGGGLNFKWF